MNSLRLTIKQWARLISGSIAFYPAIIAVGFIWLALFMTWVEYKPWLMQFKDTVDVLLVGSLEDGRLVLGTLVASTISLMVFSFSMVMVVLNQASANLSPRLLPGLITVKDNQVVLGFYLGTISYCFMMILNIHPSADEAQIPGAGIFVGMCAGLTCLGLFTYFIHSISQAIQVDNILDRVYRETLKRIQKEHSDEEMPKPGDHDWVDLCTPTAGYLKWIQEEELLSFCSKHNLQLQMVERIGHFYVAHTAYIRVSKQLDEQQQQAIHQCFVFYPQETPHDHYSFGFKQISEIAVKALSPGINDPATAIKAIDMLVMLLIHKCSARETQVLFDSDHQPRIFLKGTSIGQLLHKNITPIRSYAKHDPLVMQHLLNGLFTVFINNERETDRARLRAHIEAVRDGCDRYILNPLDRRNVNTEVELINRKLEENKIPLLA